MNDRDRSGGSTRLAAALLCAASAAVVAHSAGPPAGGVLRSAGLVVAEAAGLGQGATPPAQPPAAPAGAPRPAGPQVPTFRAGAALVRVDAYVTRDGKPVADLTADDIELLEDGRPQTIQTFELVVVRAGGPDVTRIEPSTVAASRQAASDPRARVFVIFLDTKHVHITSAQRMRRPLATFLDRVVGQDDLVALMTPTTAASDITFSRRVASMATLLDQPWTWGQYSAIDADDPVEENYERCYPATLTQPFEDQLLGRMVLRRRVKLSLDALRDLVVHLDGLREERKAVLVVSEGWTLFGEDRSLFPPKPMASGVFVGPDGRLRTGDPSVEYPGMSMRECERDRMLLAQLDTEREFRTLLDEANRANVSFYPVDPRGLPAVDSPMGPYQPLSPARDAQKLGGRLESLRTMAGATDGQAILGSNDVEGGMRRIVDDMSSYYLMSYTSTNSRLDGRFRSITVRVKRPGVEVRARRGYRAPSFSIRADMDWVWEVFAECGITYDSSIFPVKHATYGSQDAPRFPYRIEVGDHVSILEIPPSTVRLFGSNVPIAGGGYLRMFPYWFISRSIRKINKEGEPAVIYFHPWELDIHQTKIEAGTRSRFRHYTNLRAFEPKLRRLLAEFKFSTIEEVFHLKSAGKSIVKDR